MLLPNLLLAGFVASILAPLIQRMTKQYAGLILALWPAAFATAILLEAPQVLAGEPFQHTITWAEGLNLSISFYIDGLSVLFALMVSVIGTVVLIYASGYMKGYPYQGRFYAILLMFMTAMNGVVCSGNIIALFIFWELTGISSFLLIGFNHEKPESRAAALQALLITTAGGLALLAGLLIMGWVGGSFEITELFTQQVALQQHPLYFLMLCLFLAGAFTKSAQFPFHFWLPQAMAAPTPISAYLHSATMVKLGVFLLARFFPMLSGTEEWMLLVMTVGGITMVMGAVRSPFQDDLKAVLAYSTLSVLGMLIFLLGMGTSMAVKGMVLLTMAHALYKAPLFLVTGILDHETGTRSVSALSGLRKKMPLTFVIGLIAAASMIGLPPTLGFIGKETLLEAFQLSPLAWLTGIACVVTGIGLMGAAWLAGIKPFLGAEKATPKPAHEAPLSMWLAPLLLASLALVLIVFNKPLLTPLTNSAIGAIQASESAIKVKLWHGFTLALGLSVLIIALGALFIRQRDQLILKVERWRIPKFLRPSKIYQWSFEQMFEVAALTTRLIQRDSLRANLSIILTVFLVIGSAAMMRNGGFLTWPGLQAIHPLEILLGITMVIAALLAMRAKSMMRAAVSLGVVGFSMSAVFMVYGAVDLAITQIVVDTLTVLIFVLVVHKLPQFKSISTPLASKFDAALATLAGLFMTILVLKADLYSTDPPISGFFNEKSLTEAYGQNIVNVILVDFRALDTFGEITVLMIAAMGVYLLVHPFRRASQKHAAAEGELDE